MVNERLVGAKPDASGRQRLLGYHERVVRADALTAKGATVDDLLETPPAALEIGAPALRNGE
eukprot:31185-Alexandrium_andersonii.AAC.1